MNFKTTVIKSAVTRVLIDLNMPPKSVICQDGIPVDIEEGHLDIVRNTMGESIFTVCWSQNDQYLNIRFNFGFDHKIQVEAGNCKALQNRILDLDYESNVVRKEWVAEMVEECMTRLASE
jgi:hypothetical protein